jgi:transcriptional regulator with XRE-family HTH domain
LKKFANSLATRKAMHAKAAIQLLDKLTGGPLTFGRMLQAIRLGEEQSLDMFARLLEVSRTNLSNIEHGRRGVSVERAARWAELLGYSQPQFVRLALQAQLHQAGLKLYAQVTSARESSTEPRTGKRPKRARAWRAVTSESGKRQKLA